MKIAIHTYGTLGDVVPYVSLACELQRRGHDVHLAGPGKFSSVSARREVTYVALPDDLGDLIDTPEGRTAIAESSGFGAGIKLLGHARRLMPALLDAEWNALRAFAPDIVVHHPKCLAAPHYAAVVGVPAILASPLPAFTATSAFPSPLLPFADLGPLNRLSHLLGTKSAAMLFRSLLKTWRETLPPPPPVPGRLSRQTPFSTPTAGTFSRPLTTGATKSASPATGSSTSPAGPLHRSWTTS